jgi:enoyl-CoA hydratase/carnithine racemase
MKPPTLYLDTSAIGGYFDDEWMAATQELWRQMEAGQWRFVTSLVAAEELEEAPEWVRELFQRSFSAERVLEVTREVLELAKAYVEQGVVSPKFEDDARHVAACTVHGVGLLVSWNFKHLVNVRREAGFNGMNLLKGYPEIRIVNPLELIYDPEDEDV